MFKYCVCGAKNEYSLSLPKFCQDCGKNFSEVFAGAVPTKSKKLVLPKSQLDEDGEEEEDEDDEMQARIINRRRSTFNLEGSVDYQPYVYSSDTKWKDVAGTEEPVKRDPNTPKVKSNRKRDLESVKQKARPSQTPIEID